ncbi:MAG TPA: hypothetical protein VJG48_00660, partial [Candidatus Paceibacterota bacterium]
SSTPPLVQNPGQDDVGEPTTNPPKAGAPVVATNKNAIPTDTTVVLTGVVNPNGAFTSYWYDYGTTQEMTKVSATQMLGSGFVNLSAPVYITGLTKDTTYYFRLNAKNEFGQVSDGQYSFVTTQGYQPPVGSAPTVKTITASGITASTANLDGQVTPNKSVTQFWFEYGTTANLGNTTNLVSVGDGTVVVPASASLTGLAPATTYYRINAQNQFGTVNGSILTFKTGPAISVVTTVKTNPASKVGATTATVHGSVNPGGIETTYWFEYGPGVLEGELLSMRVTTKKSVGNGSGTVEVSSDLSDLKPNTTYPFRLVARNSRGTVIGDWLSFKTK